MPFKSHNEWTSEREVGFSRHEGMNHDDTWWLDIADLDDEQRQVIELPKDGSYLIVGLRGRESEPTAPSSGISLGCSGGANVQVLMFGRALRDFVSGGAATTS